MLGTLLTIAAVFCVAVKPPLGTVIGIFNMSLLLHLCLKKDYDRKR